MNNLDEAIEHLKHALATGPETAEMHSTLGMALGTKGQTAEAIPQFERALVLSPNLSEAHYYLGVALVMSGRGADGLAHWRQVLRKEPDNVQVLNEAAWVLATSADAALRNGKEALALAEHAAQLTSGRAPEILGTLAAAYAETGDFDRAVETGQRAADMAAQSGNQRLAANLNGSVAQFQEKNPIRQR
jgi:tetratricopeptide (TPR) repeat protein